MGQRSQGELYTERQNNGRLLYNRAPHARPDRFTDSLLHQHGTHQASAASNADSLGYAELLAIRNSGQAHTGNFFVALLQLVAPARAIPAVLMAGFMSGAGLHCELGINPWASVAAGLATMIGAPWLLRRLHWTAVNFKALANAPGNSNTCIPDPSSLWNLNWKQLEGSTASASRRSLKNG